MLSAKAKKVLWNVGLPLAGFGVGWYGYNYIEEKGMLSHDFQQKLTISNLKAQLYLQRFLPASVTEKYGYPESVLKEIIEQMQKGYTDSHDRMTFEQVLRECDEEEQIGFLEEHASEEIPYFYIADVFNAWAQLHKDVLTDDPTQRTPRQDRSYESSLLCNRVWETLVNAVMPYDVCATCLCILAQKNTKNAKQLASLVDVAVLLQKYGEYMTASATQKRGSSSSASSVEFAPAQVTAATLLLLETINDASIHRRLLPGIGRASTGPLPLASHVTAETWCGAFPSTLRTTDERPANGVRHFVDAMDAQMKCATHAEPSS